MCLQRRHGCAYCGATIWHDKVFYCTWSLLGECTRCQLQDRMLPGPFQQCDSPSMRLSCQETTNTGNEMVEDEKEGDYEGIELASSKILQES